MPAMASARPTDDFDMSKLQKTLKQRQRHSSRTKAQVAKLTPSEIRSLNNSVLATPASSQNNSKGTSPATSRRSTNATPPASPDDGNPLTHRNSISRNSINVPTPPHTPNGHRRSSQSSTRSHHHSNGHSHDHRHHHGHHGGHSNGVIYAPRPRGHAQAAFIAANGVSSRPSSSGSSTYRGLPTYRGPEVTRTGSMNMLQRPSPTIVANPLSNFSRPRQSMFSTSPERSRHDPQELSSDRPHLYHNGRANSFPTVSAASSRPASPPRVTDSPVSILVDYTEKFPAFDPDDPHNQPKDLSGEEDNHIPASPRDDEPAPETAPELPASPVAEPQEPNHVESPKKEKQKRFTLGAALFGGDKSDKSAVSENQEKAGKLKKARRRTLSFSKSDESSQTTPVPEAPASPEGEKTVDGTALENQDFDVHPAIRPLSVVIPTEDKGKGKEIYSTPVYARCSCCGKIKKPSGFNNELSPVMENENLRTNFSFELERTSDSPSRRRSSDGSRTKFTPIIPMVVSATEARQASIEPYTTQNSPSTNPKSALTTSPRKSKKHLDPPRFVRFASLHGRRNTNDGIITEEEEEEARETDRLMNTHSEVDEQVVATKDFAEMSTIERSQPVLDASISLATVTSKSEEAKPSQPPLAREQSFDSMPEPNLGIDFKEFVMPVDGPLAKGLHRDRKWGTEVMAV